MSDLINRQDAIDALLKIKDERDSVYYTSAIYTAIDALEQLPSAQPGPCGDMISIEYLKEHIEACWINGRPRHALELNELLSWIDDVPSAQPEKVRAND